MASQQMRWDFFVDTLNTYFPNNHLIFLYYEVPYLQQNVELLSKFSTSHSDKLVQLQDSAVQTDKTYFGVKINGEDQVSNSEKEYEEFSEFPLPNKQLLHELFNLVSSKRKDIYKFIAQMSYKQGKTLKNFYKSIGEKIIHFKKTKEQIIKFLIRRAWKKQKVGADGSREKYYSEYKSMNSAYLTTIFNEPSFVAAYEQMLKTFDADFDALNQERFNRFYEYLLNCYIKNNLVKFKASKQCKSKLPYPQSWKLHIREIAYNLYENYTKNSSLNEKNEEKEEQQVKDTVYLGL